MSKQEPNAQTPAGWKLVPIEPTQKMIGAAEEAREAYASYTFADAYREMVQAAPSGTSTLQSAPDLPAIQLKVIDALRDSTCFSRNLCQCPPCPCTHGLAKMIASCALSNSSPIHGGK